MNLDFEFHLDRGAFRFSAAGHLEHNLIGVFGPSGSGKTTFLHLIAGILTADRGYLKLDGSPLWDHQTRVPMRDRRIAVVFQTGRLFPHFTVAANLRYGMKLRPPEQQKIPFDEVVQLLDLGPLLHRKPHALSGGQTQRVALGRALLCSPRLLLLDEPLAALDRGLKSRILPYLRRVRDDLAVPMIYVSHDLTELQSLTNQLLIMDAGRILAQGAFLELVQQEGVLDIMHDLGLLNVVPLRLDSRRPDEGVAFFKPSGGSQSWVGSIPQAGGDHHFGILRPEDVALVKHRVGQVSIQNQIPGVIENLIISRQRALCVVNCGVRLLAEVTPFAIHNLNLAPGQDVFCLFKAQALSYLPGNERSVSPT